MIKIVMLHFCYQSTAITTNLLSCDTHWTISLLI